MGHCIFNRQMNKKTRTDMKQLKFTLLSLGMLLAATAFQSCLDDDDKHYVGRNLPNALVTVKTMGDSCYLQLDDSTTLYPINIKKLPFGNKEVRALTNFTITDKTKEHYDKVVYVNWIDSILTKQTVPNLGDKENAEKYGNDPVDIVRDWVTIAEDGYLTLRFRTYWGGSKTHTINLVTGVNPNDPYEVELRHNANGDPQLRQGDALVAFDLENNLPDTQNKTVKLTIRWNSYAGEKTVAFDYCSRKTIVSSSLLNGYDYNSTLIK